MYFMTVVASELGATPPPGALILCFIMEIVFAKAWNYNLREVVNANIRCVCEGLPLCKYTLPHEYIGVCCS